MLKMIGHGLIEKWKKSYWPKKKQCKTFHQARALTIEDTQGVFYILITLIAVSGMALVLELVYHSIHDTLRVIQQIRKFSLHRVQFTPTWN